MRTVPDSSCGAPIGSEPRRVFGAPYAWYAVGLLCLVNLVAWVNRVGIVVLTPAIKIDLGLSDTQLGMLTGVAYSLVAAISVLPIARWADKGVRRTIIALALLVGSGATALCGAAAGFWQLFVARGVVAIGESGCAPASNSLLADYAPPKHRAIAFTVCGFGGILGITVGPAVAAYLVGVIGWRWTFVTLGLPGLALALIVILTLREAPRGAQDSHISATPGPANFGQALRELSHMPIFILILAYSTLVTFDALGLGIWMTIYFVRVLHANLAEVTAFSGALSLALSSIGLLAGGALATWLARFNAALPFAMSGIAILLAQPFVIASLFVNSAYLSVVLSATALLATTTLGASIPALMVTSIPPPLRATATSFLVLGATTSSCVAPLIVGVLSDNLAPYYGDLSLRYALLLPACLYTPLGVIVLLIARELRRSVTAGSQRSLE